MSNIVYRRLYKLMIKECKKGFELEYPNKNFFHMKKNLPLKCYLWENVDEDLNIYENFNTFGYVDNPWHSILETTKECIRFDDYDEYSIGELCNAINLINSENVVYHELSEKEIDEFLKEIY